MVFVKKTFYLLLSIILFACNNTSKQPQATHLILADATQPVFALVYIAQSLGYFKDENLTISYLPFTSGRDALNSVVDGKADVATVYETPIVLHAAKNSPIKVISTLHHSERNTAIVARRDSDIYNIQDLAGKNIAVPFNTNAHFFLQQLLQSEQVDINKVTLFNFKPQELAHKIANKHVDAIAVWNPALYQSAQALEESNRVIFTSDLYSETSALVTTAESLKQSKPAYLALLKGIKKAEQFLLENPEQAKAIVIQHLKSSLDVNTIEATWDNFEAEAILSNSLVNLLSQEATWLKNNDIIKEVPNMLKYIDTSLLKSIDKHAVSIN